MLLILSTVSSWILYWPLIVGRCIISFLVSAGGGIGAGVNTSSGGGNGSGGSSGSGNGDDDIPSSDSLSYPAGFLVVWVVGHFLSVIIRDVATSANIAVVMKVLKKWALVLMRTVGGKGGGL